MKLCQIIVGKDRQQRTDTVRDGEGKGFVIDKFFNTPRPPGHAGCRFELKPFVDDGRFVLPDVIESGKAGLTGFLD